MFMNRVMILLFAVIMISGCDHKEQNTVQSEKKILSHDNSQLLGTWETDADLTESLPENQSLDAESLQYDAWMFGIQIKMRRTFFPDGYYTFKTHTDSATFKYNIVSQHGNKLTVRSIIVADPESHAISENDAFESEWMIINAEKIANKLKGKSGEFWMVYRKVP